MTRNKLTVADLDELQKLAEEGSIWVGSTSNARHKTDRIPSALELLKLARVGLLQT